MTAQNSAAQYSERLLPSPGFFVAWLLLIPASALVMTPINKSAAIPVAIGLYVLAVVIFYVLSPVLRVENGKLTAGRATIPLELVGEVETLGSDALRHAIGPGADARAYLVVRGWIQRGIKVEITDENDPTPHWIITSRKPVTLQEAIQAAKVDA